MLFSQKKILTNYTKSGSKLLPTGIVEITHKNTKVTYQIYNITNQDKKRTDERK